MSPSKPQLSLPGEQPRHSSTLMRALNRFTGGLSVGVRNPMADKYGAAYDHLVSGDACRYREDIETAIDHYQQALSIREDMGEAWVGIAKCLKRKGDVMGAINNFKKALQRNSFDTDVQLEIAKCYSECGYLVKASQHYERAMKLDPGCIEGMFGLALVVEINNDIDYAISLYERILTLDAEFLPAYNNLGSLYMRLGQYLKAEELFRQLIQKAPDFTRGYLGLAIALDKAGKRGESLETYHEVLRMKPNTRNASFIKKRIVQINMDMGKSRSTGRTTLVRIK